MKNPSRAPSPGRPDLASYERLLVDLAAAAEAAFVRKPLGNLTPGSRVVIDARDGADVDGVPCGTRGVFAGVLKVDGLEPRAAVTLDDNGELVFVRPDVLAMGG